MSRAVTEPPAYTHPRNMGSTPTGPMLKCESIDSYLNYQLLISMKFFYLFGASQYIDILGFRRLKPEGCLQCIVMTDNIRKW